MTFVVYGNWGTLTCDHVTGDVLSYNHEDSDWEKPGDGYDSIVRLDVDEWMQEYPDETLDGKTHDILDFGSWDKDGVYCGPELDWRKGIHREEVKT